MTKFVMDFINHTITGPVDVTTPKDGNVVNVIDFEKVLAGDMPVDTGLLNASGDGLLALRRGFGYEQIVYQRKPGKYLVKWGMSEKDPKAKIYELAYPWRVIIGDFHNDKLLGVRHFFLPESVYHLDQVLCAVNLPNTNTIGYNGTSVGWVCNYHTAMPANMSYAEKIIYMLERECGISEPYNDRNMSETDGTRFYQHRSAPKFMWDRVTWQNKTKEEGFEWICDENLLVELKVSKSDPRAQRYDEEGEPYTLRQAMYGNYSAYYDDPQITKPINMIALDGWSAEGLKNMLMTPMLKALNTSTTVTKPDPVIETLSEAHEFLKKIKLTIPAELSRTILAGFECNQCNEFAQFNTDGSDPTTVWRIARRVDVCDWTTEDPITAELKDLLPGFKYVWSELDTDDDNILVAESCGYWCESCVNSMATATNMIVATATFTKNAKFYVSVESYRWALLQQEYVLKVESSSCNYCLVNWHRSHDNEMYVFNAVNDVLGCINCMPYYSYAIGNVGDATPQRKPNGDLVIKNYHEDVIAGLADTHTVATYYENKVTVGAAKGDKNTADVVKVTVLFEKSPDWKQCACELMVKTDAQLQTTIDGTENVCNSCVENGKYTCLYKKII